MSSVDRSGWKILGEKSRFSRPRAELPRSPPLPPLAQFLPLAQCRLFRSAIIKRERGKIEEGTKLESCDSQSFAMPLNLIVSHFQIRGNATQSVVFRMCKKHDTQRFETILVGQFFVRTKKGYMYRARLKDWPQVA